jgi:hypothetical protein
MTIPAKQISKGRIIMLSELFIELFHFPDADNTSFRERVLMSPMTTEAPYRGTPGVVIIEIALAEIALDEITLNNMLVPP